MNKYVLKMIFISMILIVLFNSIVYMGKEHVWYFMSFTCLGVLYIFAIDALTSLAVHDMPKLFIKDYDSRTRFYDANKKPFATSDREHEIYERLHIRAWKDKLPSKMGMNKQHLSQVDDMDYVNRFLIECCRAETLHFMSALLSWTLLLIPFQYSLTVWVPIILVNSYLQILPIMVLRYNRPKVLALKRRIISRQSAHDNAEQDIDILEVNDQMETK